MNASSKRIKTDHSQSSYTQNRQNRLINQNFSHINLTNRPTSFKNMTLSRTQLLSAGKSATSETGRKIKEENVRLIIKLAEIRQRKSKLTEHSSSSGKKWRQNPERERQILAQNLRLGKSLIKIKSGKTVERVKTEIAKIVQRNLKKQRLNGKQKYNLFFQSKEDFDNNISLKLKTLESRKQDQSNILYV